MLYIIFPKDKSTFFLYRLYYYLIRSLGKDNLSLIRYEGSDQGYRKSLQKISEIPKGACVLFMGHGTAAGIYGGTSESYDRQYLLKIEDMKLFSDKNLILLSCHSVGLIKSSFKQSHYEAVIGFGALPTEMSEVEAHSKLKKQNVSENTIYKYKRFLVQMISDSIIYYKTNDKKLPDLYNRMILIINQEINAQVLDNGDRAYADLLFYMKLDMDYI